MLDWIREAWTVYELLKEQPLSFVELLKEMHNRSADEQVVLHNKVLNYIDILINMNMVKMPQPVGWDKPYNPGNDIEGNPIIWPAGIPRGHWKIYVANQVDKKQFVKQAKRSFW